MGELLCGELAERGFDASAETEPGKALAAVDAERFDVVLTDLQMEGMNGLELCERIVAARPELPVVLLTGHGTLDAAVAALRLRAFDFLTKPPDMNALAASLERAARHGRLAD
jgi:two-component system response regulator HydG